MYDVSTGNRRPRNREGEAGELLKNFVVDRVQEQLDKQSEKLKAKAETHAQKFDRFGAVLDVWTRQEPGARKPRYTRDDIAKTAVRIADAEGIDALSMRRLAQELGAGTMTLYHYVRTKDELMSLVSDEVMGEIILPPNKLRGTWREKMTAVAHSSRATLERHPWIFDIVEDPAVGPNGVRHFDQSWEAVADYPGTFADKMDLVQSVDEYVFGYVLHARNDLREHHHDDAMRDYVYALLGTGDYPTLAGLAEEHGFDELWRQMDSHGRDPRRFDRNLSRLLDGFSARTR